MANLTITVDPEILKRARIKAIHEGTSVNNVLGAYLEAFVETPANGHQASDPDTPDQAVDAETAVTSPSGEEDEAMLRARGEAIDRLFDVPRTPPSGDAPEGRGWTREEIYDRPIMRLDQDDRDEA